ncbi:MAG: class I SAM-dependent methyltransferase [Desulfomonile tiedjei]|uniref:Class I SAM-dependent methyltransferase n=1 Tax=Desulfomonile tiedjei TaxID=2358 RepID=A0A9D6V396_9BACT|nr:class I SAM-dependent methyltransferase [Desulfomonile tiedjei]
MTTPQCSERVYINQGNLPLLDMIPDGTGTRALDCGCGGGDNAKIMMSRGWEVSGVTVSENERSLASDYCEKVYVFDLNHGIPEEAGSGYDLVLMSHILEHLINPDQLLQDAKRVLNRAGVIAVALPNVLYYSQRIKFLLGRFEYQEGGIMDRTHLRFYTFTSGSRLLCRNGYSVLRSGVHGNFPLWKLRRLLSKRFEQSLNRLACSFSPNLFGLQSLYVASPIPENAE